jgi:hypothetical protein
LINARRSKIAGAARSISIVSRADFKGMEIHQLDEENHLWGMHPLMTNVRLPLEWRI